MFKCYNEATARSLALESGRLYGFGIFDGKWYVGEEVELSGCGVARIEGDYRVMVVTPDGTAKPFEPGVVRPGEQALAVARDARKLAAKKGWAFTYHLELL